VEDRSAIASRWTAKGFSCDLWVDPPGQVWEGYVHETDELVHVLEGRIELEVRGRAETLEAGREAFIPAGAVHSVRNVGGTTARWLYGYKRA
jgi:quercetin dioxygenase-like cupin family protein